ncbi:MAG: hypothetical protein ABI156_12405, partial [Caldimonas sp.]
MVIAHIEQLGGGVSSFERAILARIFGVGASWRRRSNYPQSVHRQLWITCEYFFLLAPRNDEKSSNGAVSSRVLVATMKSQQAVAKRFVGRR